MSELKELKTAEYQDLLNQYSHFDSPECYAVRISAGMHSQFF